MIKQLSFIISIYLLSAFSSWGMADTKCNVVQRYGSLTEVTFVANTYINVPDEDLSAFMHCITNRPARWFWLLFEKGASETFLKSLVEALKENNRSISRLYFDKNFISEHALEILTSNLRGGSLMPGLLLFCPKILAHQPSLPSFDEVEFKQRVENKQNELWKNQPQEEFDGPDIEETVYEKVYSNERALKAWYLAASYYQKQGYIGHWEYLYGGTSTHYYRFSYHDDAMSKNGIYFSGPGGVGTVFSGLDAEKKIPNFSQYKWVKKI